MTTFGLERPQVKGHWGIPGGEADSDHTGVEQRTEAEDTGHRSKGQLTGRRTQGSVMAKRAPRSTCRECLGTAVGR